MAAESTKMKFELLREFLEKAANSQNQLLQEQAVHLDKDILQSQEDEEVVDSDVQRGRTPEQSQNDIKLEDIILQQALPEIQIPDQEDLSTFGKVSSWDLLKRKMASAYVRDLTVSDLPADTKEEVNRFIGPKKELKVIQYGMVVSELLPKVDKPNFEQAITHIKEKFKDKNRKDLLKDFFKKLDGKYILILNDKIIDGHHFLAMAKELDVTCSLNVIDLTPTRFQSKTASLYDRLIIRYGKSNHSRQNFAKK